MTKNKTRVASKVSSKLDITNLQLLDRELVDHIQTGQQFFYYIKQYDGDIIASERGIGELVKVDGEFFLDRNRAISYYDGTYHATSRPGVLYFFDPAYPTATVESYIPEDYAQTLLSPHSVLCSIESNVPSPVELQNNTLLGRMDDRIQSIDAQELREILGEQIIAAVADTRTPVNLRSPVLNLNKNHSYISTYYVHCKPVYGDLKPPNPQRGAIIFNDKTGSFAGYDGKKWRTLAWGDEC